MRLRFIHPAIGQVVFPIQMDSQMVIGRRGGGAGIELNWDKRISRRHAVLRTTATGEVFFRDLESNNGSYHGTQKIEGEIRIEQGMNILIGETVLLVAEIEEEMDDPWGSEPTATDPRSEMSIDDLDYQNFDETEDGHDTADMSPDLDPVPSLTLLDPIPAPPRSTTARFVDKDRVEVLFVSRSAFTSFWENELSRTGMFVVTETPPPFGSNVKVVVDTPDGSVELSASIVHVVESGAAKRFGMSPGAGLQVNNLTLELRESLDRYAKGEATTLGTIRQTANTSEAIDTARHLLAACDAHQYYEALQVTAAITGAELAERFKFVEDLLNSSHPSQSPEQTRLEAAKGALSKMNSILGVTQRRLQYDFKSGHIRVGERLAAARNGTGPSLSELRRAWNLAFPDRVDRAAQLMRRAFARSTEHDFATAIQYGQEALKLNPFFDQMKSYIQQWQAAEDLG